MLEIDNIRRSIGSEKMINFLICLIISVLLSFGMSVALVQKGKTWPIRKYNLLLKKFLHKHIYYRSPEVLDCVTCTSMWMALISDIVVMVVSLLVTGSFYFFWPFTGFIAVGFTYFMFEYLNAVDNDIVIEQQEEKKDGS